MTVRITKVHSSEESTRRWVISLEGADDYLRPGTKNHVLRPTQLKLTYNKGSDDSRWRLVTAELCGPRVLKNGALSDCLIDVIRGYQLSHAPEWVQRLANGHLDTLNAELVPV